MKLGVPFMLGVAGALWIRLRLWIRTCLVIAAIIAEALHEGDSGPYPAP